MTTTDPEADILRCWQANAEPWTRAIRNNEIESRRTVTNQAMVDVILEWAPTRILDAGCGEGWLCRALRERGLETLGIDATPALVESARSQDSGRYDVMDYTELACRASFDLDLITCNFSLIGDTSTRALFSAARRHLVENGTLVIQTLHPIHGLVSPPYCSGWRQGSWTGFSGDFRDASPWFFRTLGDWFQLFQENNFQVLQVREPLDRSRRQPLSIIFAAKRRDSG